MGASRLTAAALILSSGVFLSASGDSLAQSNFCSGRISAMSGAQRSITLATDGVTQSQVDRSYRRAFAAGRSQAIAAWRSRVTQKCPRASSLWLRASGRKITACDQAMAGRFAVCATATPARKFGS